MSNIYRIESLGYSNSVGSVLYNAFKNDQLFLVEQTYSILEKKISSLLKDNDRYQEVCNKKMYCDITGLEFKANQKRMEEAFARS